MPSTLKSACGLFTMKCKRLKICTTFVLGLGLFGIVSFFVDSRFLNEKDNILDEQDQVFYVYDSSASSFWRDYGNVSSCTTRTQNVAFIKTHKTGSTTLGHLVNRFGFHYNLSFVFNKNNSQNGHLVYYDIDEHSPEFSFLPPIGIAETDHANFKYNLIGIHVRYNRKVMDSFMQPDTKYITILRNPVAQFESALSHFHFRDVFSREDKRFPMTSQQQVFHFLKQPEIYYERLKHVTWEKQMGLRWYYAKNNQMFDLGFDNDLNRTEAIRFIQTLDRELDMVLLTEYIDESLVIMRKQFCWSWDDILYISKNRRPKSTQLSESLARKIRVWNPFDVLLYEHFNRTLWRKISQYAGNFQSDLAFFRTLRSQVRDECIEKQFSTVFHTWNRIRQVLRKGASEECKVLVMSKKHLFDEVWKRQYHKRQVDPVSEPEVVNLTSSDP